MSTEEDICDICKKPLDECPEWQQILKSKKEIEQGNYKEFKNIKDYMEYLKKK